MKVKLVYYGFLTVIVVVILYYVYRYSGVATFHRSTSYRYPSKSNITCPQIQQTVQSQHLSTPSAPIQQQVNRLKYYKSRIFFSESHVNDSKADKCTLIMLTYRRLKSLPQILNSYCNLAMLDKLLVIWNDVENPVPQAILDLSKQCTVNITFIVSEENKVSNRFLPRNDRIETNCVCIMDDDLVITDQDMRHGLTAWQKFRHLLIGFTERTRGFALFRDGIYRYGLGSVLNKALLSPAHKPADSIILPPVFLHRAYLEMMFDPVMIPTDLVAYIDEIMNCDDILLNLMVTKFLKDCGWPQSGGLKLKCLSTIRSLEHMDARTTGGHRGLGSRHDHQSRRNECLNKFAKRFGYLPLVPQNMTLVI